MKQAAFRLIRLLALLLLVGKSADAQVTVGENWTQAVVESNMQVLPVRPNQAYAETAVLSGRYDTHFKPFSTAFFQGKQTENWLKLTVNNQTVHPQTLYLGTTRFEMMRAWVVTDSAVAGPQLSGQRIPDNRKSVRATGLSFFSFVCPPGKAVRIYINAVNQNARSTPQIIQPFTLTGGAEFRENYEKPANYTFMFLGASLIMLIYNSLLFFTTRLRTYLLYTGYVVFSTGYVLGLIPQIAFPLYGHMDQDRFPIMHIATLAVIFHVLTAKEVLETKLYYPKVDKLLLAVVGALVGALVLYPAPFFISAGLTNFINVPATAVAYVTLFGVGLLMTRRKHQPGTLFFVGSSIYIVGVILYLGQVLNLFPPVLFGLSTTTLFQIASTSELALFSLSIGARINEMRRRLYYEKQQLLAAQNEKLEQQVSERTEQIQHQKEEIEAQRDNLEHTLTELKATQTQLVQREKLASLGELTAGIAHEIQNPLNFVNNFSEVSLELLDELRDGPLHQLPATEKAYAEEILGDVTRNLKKVHEHGSRADSIVKSMLQHSRAGTAEKQATDLNALADEYLRLAYHGLRAKDKSFNADLRLELDPHVGQLNAVPQDMGRVLLNLYNNAFYAVQEKARRVGNGYQPRVEVYTQRDGNQVELRVRDNGVGIAEHVKQKIFQPFFTTKPTGQGTGLGLSLSYDIITKGHGGELSVATQEGEGTTFIIRIPVVA